MSNNLFISVCIPAYERADHLVRLLDSIVIQTYKNFEVVISDDSKTDVVKELVDKYVNRFTINYYKNEPSAGTPHNWNLCISRASYEWIKEMHDDDWFATADALEKFAEAAAIGTHDFIFSACNNINLDTGEERHEYLEGRRREILEESIYNLYYQNLIGHPSTVLYKRDPEITYDPQFKWVVDLDLYVRYLIKHNGYYYIPEMLINIGEDKTQITNECNNNPYVEIPEYVAFMKKFEPGTMLKHPLMFEYIWKLIKKHKVRSVADLRKLGYKHDIHPDILSIVKYQGSIPWLILKQPPWELKLKRRFFKKLSGKSLTV